MKWRHQHRKIMKKLIIISFIVVVCFSLSDAVFLKKSTITADGGVLDYQAGIMYVATPVSASEAVSKNYADTMKAADSDLLDGRDYIAFVSTAGDTMSGQLTMSGTTANISLGSNYLSGDGGDEGIFIYDDGVVSLPLQSAVRAKIIDIQLNLTDGVATKVVFGAEDFDIQGEFADSRFTAKRAGYYQISTSVIWYGPSTVADRGYNLVFRKNGSDIQGSYNIIAPSITAYFSNNITDIVYLAVDDYIEVFATSNAGVDTVDIWGGFFAIHKLS